MRKITVGAGAAALLVAAAVAIGVTATASAQPTQPCVIKNGNVTVPSGTTCSLTNVTVPGNITVQGGTVSLFGVTVNGNVTIQPGSHIFFFCYSTQGNHVIGNLWSSGAASFYLGGCQQRVDGNVWIDGTANGPENNPGDTLRVGGNLTLTHNTDQGLHGLTVVGNFVCFSKTPTPSVFLPWTIGGSITPSPNNSCLEST